jgi:hypothetical protein
MPVPLPVISKTARVALRWTESGTGQTAVNVIHIGWTPSAMTPALIFEALQDAMTASMWENTVGTASITDIDVTILDGTTATVGFPTGSPANMTGSTSGEFVPAAAAIVKFQTGLRGRANRGRLFTPFTGEGSMVDGHILAINIPSWQAAWALFQTNLQADADGPFSHVVASYDRRHGGVGAKATAVDNYVAEAALATQRRRQSRLR